MDYQPVKGMRDLVGRDALIEEFIEEAFRKVFVKYGYAPLYTPAVENFDLFKVKGAAGDAIKDEIYYFKDKSERELGLRFEFTASLARVAASTQLKLPYKRYQIGEVYRYDRPQAKRYRAFTQADIDILGVAGLGAELEVMQVIRDCFLELGLKPKVIFNSRKLLNDIFQKYAKGKEVEAMRALDKLDKMPPTEVKKMLEEKGIDPKVVDLIEKNSLAEIEKVVGKEAAGVVEVLEFEKKLKKAGLDFVTFDARLARGFDYYTGIVFEIKLADGQREANFPEGFEPKDGSKGASIGGGGRYDKLVATYGGQDTPAVGIGFGVSRILDYLVESKFTPKVKGLFLFGIDLASEKLTKIAEDLRAESVTVDVDLIGKNVGKNIEYAQKKGFTFVGIIGSDELKAKKITLKNIESGKQQSIALKDVQKIKALVM